MYTCVFPCGVWPYCYSTLVPLLPFNILHILGNYDTLFMGNMCIKEAYISFTAILGTF